MDKKEEKLINTTDTILNQIFTETFYEIFKIEEHSIRLAANNMLSLTEVHTLAAIETTGNSMSEIAAKLKIAVSTLTISINRLVSKGYVKRFRTVEDRRVVKVQLTDQGKAVVRIHEQFHERMIHTVVDHLNKDELMILENALERIISFFKEEDIVTEKKLSEQKSNLSMPPQEDIIGVETIQEIKVD